MAKGHSHFSQLTHSGDFRCQIAFVVVNVSCQSRLYFLSLDGSLYVKYNAISCLREGTVCKSHLQRIVSKAFWTLLLNLFDIHFDLLGVIVESYP